MIELMEEDDLQKLLTEYKLVREMLEKAETEDIYLGGFGRECPLTSVIPRSRDLIKKELNVKQVELRAQIRQQMDEDERQQLGIEEKNRQQIRQQGFRKTIIGGTRTEQKRMIESRKGEGDDQCK